MKLWKYKHYFVYLRKKQIFYLNNKLAYELVEYFMGRILVSSCL